MISRKDIHNFTIHHLLHALAIGCVVRFADGTRILDAGTGGGLPGIPLAILFPETSFTLSDSIGKKIRVVKEIGQSIGLTNIEALHMRAEAVPGSYDFITGRAVMDIKSFYGLLREKVSNIQKNKLQNGIFYLSGGTVEGLAQEIHPGSMITPLSTFFSEPYFESKKLIYIPVL